RHVQDLSATVGGRAVKVEQPGKDEWVVRGTRGRPVVVTFLAYCRELTVDTSHVTADHAHLLPATVALYDAHSRRLPHDVKVLGPDPAHLQNEEKIQTRFLPLVAHEFFHTWNVKRILPAAFQPYDLQKESYTDLLWLFEGFTSYYEIPILYRAKVCDDEAFG